MPTQTDVVKHMEGILCEQNHYADMFYGIREHSPISSTHAGMEVFKKSSADIIVLLSGSLPINTLKVVIYFLQEELMREFHCQIAIPTTIRATEYSIQTPYLMKHGGSS
ncbi:hypothetical protein F5148DRAFT_1322903 [Russula earlei]|uniref:Uncharacterized protein n=1 Tax=Russula earlei TaxID=71964 RepID=A0ACC0U1W0_9AGAM|nr:hypothetical protein F5148DRAFT_1322903 [Russula earlei]